MQNCLKDSQKLEEKALERIALFFFSNPKTAAVVCTGFLRTVFWAAPLFPHLGVVFFIAALYT
jgi:hypothetical protein